MSRDALAGGLRQPPRDVPLAVRVHLMFGRVLGIVGWAIFGFGMVFVWVFAPAADVDRWLYFDGELMRTPGRVRSSVPTSYLSNNVRVFAVEYRYVLDGIDYDGTSYGFESPDEGAAVEVELPPSQPSRSRIVGMSSKPFGPWVLIVGVFPAVGLALALAALVRGQRVAHLLASGEVATGRLCGQRPTNVRVNNRTVFELTFAFTDSGGCEHEAKARTHRVETLTDDQEEELVYDPLRPERAVLLDHLPGTPRITAHGVELARGGSLWPLLLPTVLLGGHGLVALWLLG